MGSLKRARGFWPVMLLTGIVLAGCSAEPTEADLTRTLQKELQEVNALTTTLIGDEASSQTALQLISLDKTGCIAGEAPNHYLCDAEVVVDSPEAGRRTLKTRLHMRNEKQGWTLVKQLRETSAQQ